MQVNLRLYRALTLVFVSMTAFAAAPKPPHAGLEIGELGTYDASTNTISIRTTHGEKRFPLAAGASLQEGGNFLSSPTELERLRGHHTKVTVGVDGVATRLMIAPEQLLDGVVLGYDRHTRQLSFRANSGDRELPISKDTLCYVGRATITTVQMNDLPRYEGHSAKITISRGTGRVLSVWLSDKTGSSLKPHATPSEHANKS